MLPLFANRSIDSAGNLPSPYLIDWSRQVVAGLSPTTTPEPPPEPVSGYLSDTTKLTAGAGISLYGSLAGGTVIVGLSKLADSGEGALKGITRDEYGRITGTTDATITGTAGQIEVANGDAAAGVPTLSLATVTDAGGGSLQKTAFDTYGRKTGSSAATTDDLTEGSTNLYFPEAPNDGNEYVRKNAAWAIASGGGAADFTDLGDVPSAYTGAGGKGVAVNATEDGLEFITLAGSDLKTVARFYDECDKPSVTTAGWTADLSSGTISVQQSVTGMVGAYAFNSGAGSGNRAAVTAPGFKVTVGADEVRIRFRVQPQHLPSGSQQTQYSLGLVNNVMTSSTYRILLEAVDSLASGNWVLKYVNPSGNGVSPNNVTLTAGAIADIDLVFPAGGASVSVLVNNVLQDTLALPYAFDPMHPGIISRKNGATGVSSTLYVDKVLVEQDQ